MDEQTITLSGMTCGACIKLVTKILSRIQGVNNVLSVEQGLAKVSVSELRSKNEFAQAFSGTPYKVESIS